MLCDYIVKFIILLLMKTSPRTFSIRPGGIQTYTIILLFQVSELLLSSSRISDHSVTTLAFSAVRLEFGWNDIDVIMHCEDGVFYIV